MGVHLTYYMFRLIFAQYVRDCKAQHDADRCTAGNWKTFLGVDFVVNLHKKSTPPRTPRYIFRFHSTESEVLQVKQIFRLHSAHGQPTYRRKRFYSLQFLAQFYEKKRACVRNTATKGFYRLPIYSKSIF